MSLRQLKRKAMRQQIKSNEALKDKYRQSVKELDEAERIKGIIQQGVTPKMLEEAKNNAYNRGYAEGLHNQALPYIKTFCAALCIALHKEQGFGAVRCARVLAEVTDIVRDGTWIDPEEVIEQAEREIGIDLTFVREAY